MPIKKIVVKIINSFLYRCFKKRFLVSNTKSPTGTALRINEIIKFTSGVKYLEIGVNYGYTFEGVIANYKVAVDPEKRFIPYKSGVFFKGTSDEFFCEDNTNFDMVFVDGLHEYRQVLRDIINSLNLLSEKGKVIIDDVFPQNFNTAIKEWYMLSNDEKLAISKGRFSWQGDVYKAIFLLMHEYKNQLFFATITDNNHIQTIVWKKSHKIKLEMPSDKVITFYNEQQLVNKLKNGIPKNWNPCTMEELLINFEKVNSID
jgi:hypothetical protein